MSIKKRLLRLLVIFLVAGLFGGYFAFSTFLFSPLEGGLGADVASLVPRDVEFFVARADIARAFDEFPRLEVMNELEEHPAWQTWMASPEYAELAQSLGVEDSLAGVRELQAQIPLGIRLEGIFGGEDLALAGYLRGRDMAQADWAAYGRLNWIGKLGIALLSYPKLLGLEAQGISVGVEEDYVTLSGPNLPRELYIARIRDVGVVATSTDLVETAIDLEARKGEDSFGQSARYFDYIHNANRNRKRDEIELFVNLRKVLENLQQPGAWPDVKSQTLAPAFAGRFFQANSVKELAGVIGFDQGVDVDLHGSFSSELITPNQARLYRQRGVDRDEIIDALARLVPADACLFLYIRGNVGDLLSKFLESLLPADRELITDAFRSTGRYENLGELVSEIDSSLKNRLALIVRPNDYPEDPDGPPHDDQTVFAVALIGWTQEGGEKNLHELRDLIGQHANTFGLKGRNERELGFYKNYEGGFETREYWSEFVPGSGVIVTMTDDDHVMITTQLRMLGHLRDTYYQGETRGYPRLADRSDFNALLTSSIPEANLLLWFNPQSAVATLRQQAQQRAEESVIVNIDWKIERARAEDQVIRENFPGQRRGQLSPEVQDRVDEIVDPMMESLEARVKDEQIPILIAQQERIITYAKSVSAALMMLALDQKEFKLSLRVVTPL